MHLQCHIGTDTISLARLGGAGHRRRLLPERARRSRASSRRDCGIDARFVESELYAVPDVLGPDFDLVYTGVGALNWLPDIAGWARVVAGPAAARAGGCTSGTRTR